MKITIIPIDGAVYKDGVSYVGLDLSSAPVGIHALQFNDVSHVGWVEFVDDDFGNKPANQPITSLPAWATTAIAKWDEADELRIAKELAQAEAAAAAALLQPTTTGTQSA